MRLIDADKLHMHISDLMLSECLSINIAEMFHVIIDDAQTVDANPVVHGEWIIDEKHIEEIYTNPVFCSVCGQDVVTEWGQFASYCPNCGAKMEIGDTQNE